MSWLKRKLDVIGKRKDAERRLPKPNSLSQVEQLESRLCLGSLTSPDVGDWTPDDPNDPILEPADLSADLSLSETTEVEPDEGYETQESDSTATQTLDPSTSTSSTSGTNTGALDLGLDADQTQVDMNLDESAPAVETQSTADGGTDAVEVEDDDTETMGVVSNAVEGSTGEAGPDGGQQAVEGQIGSLSSNTYLQANAEGYGSTEDVHLPPWWLGLEEPVTIRYDFRDLGEFENYITEDQKIAAVAALDAWSAASGGMLQFVQDTEANFYEIMNIGTGELEAFGAASGGGGILGLGGGVVSRDAEGDIIVAGNAWLDVAENWDSEIGNGNPTDTVDFFTVVGHEAGHVLGFHDSLVITQDQNIMRGFYDSERGAESFATAVREGTMYLEIVDQPPQDAEFTMRPMMFPQLTAEEVTRLMNRASAATASDDAVIAVVDRGGTILGVHVEAGVIANIENPANTAIATLYSRPGDLGAVQTQNGVIDTAAERRALAFFAEGAVAKARTAAFFSNGDPTNIDEESPLGTRAPLTSRLVRFISQTTITQREVQGIATVDATLDPTLRGPGYVAPIGLGGHFPPEVRHTPPVDLFAIEHTNRDRIPGDMSAQVANAALFNNFNPVNAATVPGAPTLVGAFTPMVNNRFVGGNPVNPNQDPTAAVGANDILRFNIAANILDDTMVQNGPAANGLREPLSFGEISGLDPDARSRGIATLPGGIPIFRDVNAGPGNIDAGIGDTLIGGIGVFFPGLTGFADFEQGFKPGIEQAEFERTNAPKVLEAEFMALVAVGGSLGAARVGIPLAKTDLFANDPLLAAIPNIDLPFGRLDLVGISLQVIGPEASRQGVGEVILRGLNIGTGPVSGAQVYAPPGAIPGREVPFGWLVPPQNGNGITAAEVAQIINNAIIGAQEVRAAVRLPVSSRTRMVFAISDLDGNIVGLFRMQDATVFSIDVAVAKSRNVNYYADPAKLNPLDQLPTVPVGTAFTNRTFRFLAEPRFPSGVDGDPAGPWSTLNNPFIDPFTATNLGAPAADTAYLDTVLGRNSFNPTAPGVTANTNFLDPISLNNQNGIVFFPGSTPLYRDGVLIGGFGVSGDGVDQDDVVTFIGAQGFLPQQNDILRSDQTAFRDVRLPYQKFLRNPFG